MDLQAPDEESMVRVAVAELDDRFASIEHSRIESTVRQLVHVWFTSARVKNFVGIIAERHARAELATVDRYQPRRERVVMTSRPLAPVDSNPTLSWSRRVAVSAG